MVALHSSSPGVNIRTAFPSEEPLPGKYVYLTNSPAAQLAAVQAGSASAQFPTAGRRWRATWCGVLPDYTAAQIDLWLVTHEELRHSARMRVVFDFIAEKVVADKVLFETGDRKARPKQANKGG